MNAPRDDKNPLSCDSNANSARFTALGVGQVSRMAHNTTLSLLFLRSNFVPIIHLQAAGASRRLAGLRIRLKLPESYKQHCNTALSNHCLRRDLFLFFSDAELTAGLWMYEGEKAHRLHIRDLRWSNPAGTLSELAVSENKTLQRDDGARSLSHGRCSLLRCRLRPSA